MSQINTWRELLKIVETFTDAIEIDVSGTWRELIWITPYVSRKDEVFQGGNRISWQVEGIEAEITSDADSKCRWRLMSELPPPPVVRLPVAETTTWQELLNQWKANRRRFMVLIGSEWMPLNGITDWEEEDNYYRENPEFCFFRAGDLPVTRIKKAAIAIVRWTDSVVPPFINFPPPAEEDTQPLDAPEQEIDDGDDGFDWFEDPSGAYTLDNYFDRFKSGGVVGFMSFPDLEIQPTSWSSEE